MMMIGAARPSEAATDAQVAACRNRVLQLYPGLSPSGVAIEQAWESNGSVRLDWTTGGNNGGLCVIGPHNEVYQFLTSRPSGSTWYTPAPYAPSTVDFGNLPGIGQFAVVNNSANAHNGVVDFDAYVNGYGPTRWTAVCNDGRLVQGNNELPFSPQAQYVVNYVCSGGPPQQSPAGMIDFGDVPGLGHFVMQSSSRSARNGYVGFDAWINNAGPQRWVADCSHDLIERGGNYAPNSPRARYVASYACSAGPPLAVQTGTINFGYVPGIGQFAALNSSSNARNGVVQFLAYVNGAGPTQWLADCGSYRLAQNGSFAPDSQQAHNVVNYICSGWGR
jgi:hypothetical protein